MWFLQLEQKTSPLSLLVQAIISIGLSSLLCGSQLMKRHSAWLNSYPLIQLHLQRSPLSRISVAMDNARVPQRGQNLQGCISKFPTSSIRDQWIPPVWCLFTNALCSPDHADGIHIQVLISCLELLQHPFLCPLQIIVLSVQNVFAKGICPAPSFLKCSLPCLFLSWLLYAHQLPVFSPKAFFSISAFHLSFRSLRSPPATHAASLSSGYKLLSKWHLWVFCRPHTPR